MEYITQEKTKLNDAIQFLYPDSSKRTLQNWLKAGRFSVNGRRVYQGNLVLDQGAVVSAEETFRTPKVPGLKIIYEDRYLIGIEKPSGLLSVPLDDEVGTNHALGRLREHFRSDAIFPVHRLDREASGTLIFARGTLAEEKMKDLFEAHDLERRYFAILEGNLKEEEGIWNIPLLELPSYRVVPSEAGKDAITHFKVIRRSSKYTYVWVTLETGRKHQIRVHCQTIGHPILGDARYGSQENPIDRLSLHAVSLKFIHPFTKKQVSLISPIPLSFKKLGAPTRIEK
jgi:tRNA pseudouridine32 synthase/23S rRNA pseudouridine746 synthase/23S rRNA pseudouridine1911/1915/1917 synthase